MSEGESGDSGSKKRRLAPTPPMRPESAARDRLSVSTLSDIDRYDVTLGGLDTSVDEVLVQQAPKIRASQSESVAASHDISQDIKDKLQNSNFEEVERQLLDNVFDDYKEDFSSPALAATGGLLDTKSPQLLQATKYFGTTYDDRESTNDDTMNSSLDDLIKDYESKQRRQSETIQNLKQELERIKTSPKIAGLFSRDNSLIEHDEPEERQKSSSTSSDSGLDLSLEPESPTAQPPPKPLQPRPAQSEQEYLGNSVKQESIEKDHNSRPTSNIYDYEQTLLREQLSSPTSSDVTDKQRPAISPTSTPDSTSTQIPKSRWQERATATLLAMKGNTSLETLNTSSASGQHDLSTGSMDVKAAQKFVLSPAWQSVNELLRRNGFVGIMDSDLVDESSLAKAIAAVLKEVLQAFENRGSTLEQVANDRRHLQETAADSQLKLMELGRELLLCKDRLRVALARDKPVAQSPSSADATMVEQQLKRIEKERNDLFSKLAQTEAMLKLKEDEVQRLEKRMGQLQAQEEQRVKSAKSIFQQYYKRSPNSRNDTKELVLIDMYEEERKKHQSEIEYLRSQLAAGGRSTSPSSPLAGTPSSDNARTLRQELNKLQEKYAGLEKEYAQAVQNFEIRVAHAQRSVKSLEDENSKLLVEIQQRPSAEQHQQVLRELDSVKTRVQSPSSQQQAVSTGGSGAVVDIPPHEWNAKRPLSPRKEYSRQIHQEQSVAETKRMIVEASQILGVQSTDQLIPTLKKSAVVLSTMPKMESFISQVCKLVGKGRQMLDQKQQPVDITPKLVIPILETWISEMLDLQQRREWLSNLIIVLRERHNANTLKSVPLHDTVNFSFGIYKSQLLEAIKELVENENKFVSNQYTFKLAQEMLDQKPGNAADKALAPEQLLRRLVQHYQNLFDVKSLEGVLPSMNQLYLTVSEAQNAFRSLNDVLGLPSSTSTIETLQVCRRTLQLLKQR